MSHLQLPVHNNHIWLRSRWLTWCIKAYAGLQMIMLQLAEADCGHSDCKLMHMQWHMRSHALLSLSHARAHTNTNTHGHASCHCPLPDTAGFWKGNSVGHLARISAEVVVSTSSLAGLSPLKQRLSVICPIICCKTTRQMSIAVSYQRLLIFLVVFFSFTLPLWQDCSSC